MELLVSMKDIGDKNDGSITYGFVTTGESWQMLQYHDGSFQVTDKMEVLFAAMSDDKETWISGLHKCRADGWRIGKCVLVPRSYLSWRRTGKGS